jgi:hypothetical protein
MQSQPLMSLIGRLSIALAILSPSPMRAYAQEVFDDAILFGAPWHSRPRRNYRWASAYVS